MNRHPGREEQTIHLLKSIELKKGMKALDLGAGEGETVRIMKAFGLNVQGVDLVPRSSEVQQGDFLDLQYAADSMDLCISQCAFFVSRDQKKAVSECWRVLKKGGFLLLSEQGLRFSVRRIRLLSGENIIWKQSGMIHSAARIISFCRKNTKAEK